MATTTNSKSNNYADSGPTIDEQFTEFVIDHYALIKNWSIDFTTNHLMEKFEDSLEVAKKPYEKDSRENSPSPPPQREQKSYYNGNQGNSHSTSKSYNNEGWQSNKRDYSHAKQKSYPSSSSYSKNNSDRATDSKKSYSRPSSERSSSNNYYDGAQRNVKKNFR